MSNENMVEKTSNDCSDELEGMSDHDIELKPLNKNIDLHFSAALGLLDVVKTELETSTKKIDDRNFLGWTPLMMAVRNGRLEVVKFLLEKGADATKKNKYGANIFMMSVISGNIDIMTIILQHMLQGGISRNRIQEHISPVSLAVLSRNHQVLKKLIALNFNVNVATPDTNISPLMCAAAAKDEVAFSILLKNGADKNTKNYMDLTCDDIKKWRIKGLDDLNKSRQIEKPQEVESLPFVVPKAEEENTKNSTNQEEREKTFTVSSNNPNDNFVHQEVCVPQPREEQKETCQTAIVQEIIVKQEPEKEKVKKGAVAHLTLPTVPPHMPHDQQSYMQSYNMPYANYVPLMASPYNVPPIGTPVSPITPMMMPNPYQFFPATVEAVANPSIYAIPNTFAYPGSVPYFFSPRLPVNEGMNYANYPNSPYCSPYYCDVMPVSPNFYNVPNPQ